MTQMTLSEVKPLDASRAIVDAWCERYANGMPPVTARDQLATDILALIQPTPAETEGDWVLVPREATDEMVLVAYLHGGNFKAGYRAMLAASPAPPPTDGEGDLVARLREFGQEYPAPLFEDAATTIEALRAERDAIDQKRRELLDRCVRLNNRAEYAEAQVSTLSRQLEEAREAAFEECAKIADDRTPTKHDGTLAAHVTGKTIAAAIRRAKETVSHG